MINQTDTASQTTSTLSQTNNPYINPNGILGKDDFMKLMLIELQYQDPTEPMDTEKILTQTSELASLEAADNTRKTLESLTKSLASSQQFSAISAIGKVASLGTDAISHAKGSTDSFDIYFPDDVKNGTLTISDNDGNVVKTVKIVENAKGVYNFEWDGKDNEGNLVDDGIYHIGAEYYDMDGNAKRTAYGAYPIESVRFDNGKALVKLGSNYIPLDQVVEIY